MEQYHAFFLRKMLTAPGSVVAAENGQSPELPIDVWNRVLGKICAIRPGKGTEWGLSSISMILSGANGLAATAESEQRWSQQLESAGSMLIEHFDAFCAEGLIKLNGTKYVPETALCAALYEIYGRSAVSGETNPSKGVSSGDLYAEIVAATKAKHE